MTWRWLASLVDARLGGIVSQLRVWMKLLCPHGGLGPSLMWVYRWTDYLIASDVGLGEEPLRYGNSMHHTRWNASFSSLPAPIYGQSSPFDLQTITR